LSVLTCAGLPGSWADEAASSLGLGGLPLVRAPPGLLQGSLPRRWCRIFFIFVFKKN
jgi:hypothetical protein